MKMKKVKRSVCSLMMCIVLMCNVTYAMPNVSWEQLPGKHNQSILLSGEENTSIDITNSMMRGKILSSGMIEISNQQDGTLHIAVDTYAHTIVDKIYQTVFLDVWDATKEDWVNINHWDFERSIDEVENLSSYHVGFTVMGCEVNRYYRARAMHLVQIGDDMEGKATETNGVLLTDHEV